MARRIRVLVIAALALFIIAAFAWFWTGSKRGPTPVRLSFRLDWTPGAEHSFVYVAMDKGYYKELGLEVEVIPGEGSSVSAKLVGAGENDFALCSGDSALVARTQGVPLVLLAVLYDRTPMSIYALKEKGISKPTDLYGRRYGATYKSTTYQQFIAFTNAVGLDRSRIEIVPSPGKGQELLTGDIDAQGGYTYIQPVQLELSGHPVTEILVADYGVKIYSMSIITNERNLTQRRDVVSKFMEASLRGYEWMRQHPDAALESFLKYNPSADRKFEGAKLRKLLYFLFKDAPPKIGWQTEEGWKQTQDTLISLGILEKRIDVRQLFTTDFLN